MKAAFIVVIVLHGLIHLMGFLKGMGLAELRQLPVAVGVAGAMLWLFAAAAYLCTAALVAWSSRYWWVAAAPAMVASQLAIVTAWSEAKYGTAVNVLLLVPLALALLELRPSSFTSSYRREVQRGLARAARTTPITDGDLERLPAPVQKYLRRAGVVGKPRVHDVRVVFAGEMKGKPDADWMSMRAEQHSFFDEPTRAFLMTGKILGIPFEGFHLYVGPSATMRVRIAGLLQVVDARGPEMNQSETVTMFNDMCLLAPATLVDAPVHWEAIDSQHVRGTFTNAGNTISAILIFDEHGDLANFTSNDRYQSADGKTYVKYPWSTPVRDYKEHGGIRLASHGDAVWSEPRGEYVYARFDLIEVEYNVANAKHPVVAAVGARAALGIAGVAPDL